MKGDYIKSSRKVEFVFLGTGAGVPQKEGTFQAFQSLEERGQANLIVARRHNIKYTSSSYAQRRIRKIFITHLHSKIIFLAS